MIRETLGKVKRISILRCILAGSRRGATGWRTQHRLKSHTVLMSKSLLPIRTMVPPLISSGACHSQTTMTFIRNPDVFSLFMQNVSKSFFRCCRLPAHALQHHCGKPTLRGPGF